MSSALDSGPRLVSIERFFDAPRDLVFRAWTAPAELARWFAPDGCTVHFARIDVRAGGEFHSCIRTPDGHECWCAGTYREVDAPRRLVFTMAVADSQGRRVAPASVGMDPEWPAETVVTVTFDEQGGKTKMSLHQTVGEALARRTGAYPSWLQMFDRLALRLAAAPAHA